ncbi:MAG: hypothetical protein WD342_02080 [Verrucomicrobiales bacterium]
MIVAAGIVFVVAYLALAKPAPPPQAEATASPDLTAKEIHPPAYHPHGGML